MISIKLEYFKWYNCSNGRILSNRNSCFKFIITNKSFVLDRDIWKCELFVFDRSTRYQRKTGKEI